MKDKVIFHDPVTGEGLDAFGTDAGGDNFYRVNQVKLVQDLMRYHKVDEKEAIRMMEHSDIDNPVTYFDQIFWCE